MMAHINLLLHLTFLLWVPFISCKKKHTEERIVGGAIAEPQEFTFMASILAKETPHKFKICGGTVIGDKWILTAAHCVFQMNENKFSIFAGSNKFANGDEHKPQKFYIHPEYSNKQNDIALIKLNTPIVNDKVKKIKLNSEELPLNSAATVIGWGTTSAIGRNIPKLRYVNVVTRKCQTGTFNIFTLLFGNSVAENPKIICTSTSEGRGACNGDSGGPLIVGEKQVGIVSRGEPCATGYPDIFTNVLYYIDWITKTMQNN